MAKPIEQKFLDDRDLFALRYAEGLVFLEVEEWEDTEYERYTQLEDIESGTSLDGGYQRLEDSSNDDILFIPQDDDTTVLHVGIGIAPTQIEMFVGYPEGDRSRGSLPNLGARPTPGANFGGIDGRDSPYTEPTEEAEFVIPPNRRIGFNFQNTGNDTHYPNLKLMIRKYNVSVLDPNGREGEINAIRRVAAPGSPAPIKKVGNMDNKAQFNLSAEWRVQPISLKEARLL